MIDDIINEAASIAAGIEAVKDQSRIFQWHDKALVAEYLNAMRAAGPRSHEITAESLNLPWPIWHIIKQAYHDKAIAWKREQNELERA